MWLLRLSLIPAREKKAGKKRQKKTYLLPLGGVKIKKKNSATVWLLRLSLIPAREKKKKRQKKNIFTATRFQNPGREVRQEGVHGCHQECRDPGRRHQGRRTENRHRLKSTKLQAVVGPPLYIHSAYISRPIIGRIEHSLLLARLGGK